MLDISNVRGGYHDLDILQGIDLQVERGKIVTIIGPNGAGKSTLAKAIFGLVRVRGGDIRLAGESLVGLKPSEIVRRGICYVPQERNVFPNLSVGENLELGGFLLGPKKGKRVREMYEMFPILGEKRDQRAGELSGGQRQMLATARALMLDPEMLVLDEPSAGLAPNIVEQVFGQVAEINRQGRTILMVEQNARRALAMSHWGYVLDMGKNAVDNAGEALLDDPQVVQLYLGTLGAEESSEPHAREQSQSEDSEESGA